MSKRFGFVKACIVGAVLTGTALVSTDAFAQCCQGGGPTAANAFTDGVATSASWPADPWLWPADSTLPLKAAPAVPFWWTHGEIEAGGRDFLNDPTQSGLTATNPSGVNGKAIPGTPLGAQSLGKYYEYSIVAPGAFGGGHVATGTSDGLYQIDLWANNVGSYFQGFSDQSYMLTASKAGEQYLTFIWDQTPHVYSTSAQTPYLGIGSNNLTLPAGAVLPHTSPTLPINGPLGAFLQPTDVGIQRNTAAVIYRATDPWMAWDATANYSYMTRTGTQPFGVIGFFQNNCIGSGAGCVGGPSPNIHGDFPVEVPAPIDDNTQNFGATGEYIGTSLWGQKFTFKAAYNGSIYTDNISSFNVASPYGANCAQATAAAAGTSSCPSAQLSTPPSNAMNGFSETVSADLPFHSRYVGTTSYEMMTQNAPFLPMTNNTNSGSPVPSPNTVPWISVGALPVQSLAGNIDTLLSNNVITTQITPDLTSKLNYRYYNFDNQTPQIVFPCWVSNDGTGIPVSAGHNPCGGTGAVGSSNPSTTEASISSLSISYIKQNASEELNWRPTKEWNFAAAAGWEGYTYTEADAGYTNEYSAKGSVDWKPFGWLTARVSGSYADRIAGNYSYLNNVAAIQFPHIGSYTPNCAVLASACSSWVYSSAYQQFMFDNRQRTTANFLLDVTVAPGVTITPTFKYKDDYYPLNTNTGALAGATALGLADSKMISGGVDVAWTITPTLSIVASYYYDYYNQLLYNTTTPSATTLVTTTDQTYVNTVTAAVKWAAIPNTLFFDARYSYSYGIDAQNCPVCTNTAGSGFTGAVYPNDTTQWQRVDVTATYKFDPTWVQQMGFKGDLLVRLRYTWETNSVSNWQNDELLPLMGTSTGLQDAIWLAYYNPNYNVQMLALSLMARW